jgi:excisionase family DNA binding protein
MPYPAMAEYSGLSEMTLRRLVKDGRLKVSKPTVRTALLDRLEVDRFLEASRNENGEDTP